MICQQCRSEIVPPAQLNILKLPVGRIQVELCDTCFVDAVRLSVDTDAYDTWRATWDAASAEDRVREFTRT